MTRDEAEVLGYCWGYAGIGTEDTNYAEIICSGALRAAYRKGFREGKSDKIHHRYKLAHGPLKIAPGEGEIVPHHGWLKGSRKRDRTIIPRRARTN